MSDYNLRDLKEIRRRYTTDNPTFKFKAGDRVQLGAITETTVIFPVDDGEIYYVKCRSVNGQRSQNAGHESTDYRFVAWHNLDKYRTIEEMKKIPRLVKDDGFLLVFIKHLRLHWFMNYNMVELILNQIINVV